MSFLRKAVKKKNEASNKDKSSTNETEIVEQTAPQAQGKSIPHFFIKSKSRG